MQGREEGKKKGNQKKASEEKRRKREREEDEKMIGVGWSNEALHCNYQCCGSK